jgi:hypothetical protein
MHRRLQLAFLGLLLASAAQAAAAGSCGVRKGLYETWLSLAKHTTRPVRGSSLAPAAQKTPDSLAAEGIGAEYLAFFQCIADAAVPGDEDGGRSLCKDAVADRLAAVVCQTALYLKTGRGNPKDLLDSLPATKRTAEMIWDLQTIAVSSSPGNRYPALFSPDGPAYKIVDELFVLVLDDMETAAAKYFHIAGSAVGPDGRHVEAQIKILLRESPAVVVKHWEVLRQHQPMLKKLLSQLSAELPGAEMTKLRQGIAGFCAPDNLDCPEILKVFGRP